jgi:uncharacterized ubiquitin-like protein YukD
MQYGDPPSSIDLELPDQVSVERLLPKLISVLAMPTTSEKEQPLAYRLVSRTENQVFEGSDTLAAAGVLTGDILAVVPVGAESKVLKPLRVGVIKTEKGRLVNLDAFKQAELLVGKYDPTQAKVPEIDLTDEPEARTISRRHALLRKQGSQWLIIPLSSAKNDTIVGDKILARNEPHPLNSGDTIMLGDAKVVFEVQFIPFEQLSKQS